MQINFKRTLGIAYIIAGCVWCILNLPNLMARSKGNAFFATALALLRILLWPLFILLVFRTKGNEGGVDETAESAD